MSSIKIARCVGETQLCYCAEYNGICYDLHVTAAPAVIEQVTVHDVARDTATAERLCNLFARNLVFPGNVFEVLDDLLAGNFFM